MARNVASFTRTVVVSGALMLFTASLASAQAPAAAPPDGLNGTQSVMGTPAFMRLVDGKSVWITADGVRREGRIASFSTSALTLVEDGVPTTIPFSQIMRVEKSTHHLRNGTLIGLAAGAGLGMAAVASFCADEGCYPVDFLLVGGFYGGLGAAAGVGVGAIIKAATKHGQVIYDARRQTTVALAPIISPTRKGVAFSMSWR